MNALVIIFLSTKKNKETFENVQKWLKEIEQQIKPNQQVNILLIGNKSDLTSKRAVEYTTAKVNLIFNQFKRIIKVLKFIFDN